MALPLRALIGAACLLAAAACEKDKSNEYAPPPPPQVTVAHPVQRMVTDFQVYSGTTEAYETADIRARVQGFLEQIHFKPGQAVKKGDLLFTIEKDEFAAKVAQAVAALESADAALDLAEVTLEKSINAYNLGGMTELEVKERTAARDQAKAAVDLAQAQLERAKLDLSYCDVTSPINGRISKNLVDVGNLVGQSEPTLLATVVTIEPIYVTVDAPESVVLEFRRRFTPLYSKGVEPGQTAEGKWRQVEMAVSDETTFGHIGHIDFVDPTLDTATGTLRVRLRFENEDGFLIPGLFARVRTPSAFGPAEALVVPDEALLADQLGRFALVVTDENKVEIRRVAVGPMEDELRVVRDGLAASDRIVIKGLQRARPGSTVSPVDGTFQATDPGFSAPPPGQAPATPPAENTSKEG